MLWSVLVVGWLSTSAQQIHVEPADEWRLLRSESDVAREKGLLELAEVKARQALEIAEKGLAPDPDGLARSLEALARVYADAKSPTLAEPLMRRSVTLLEKLDGPKSFALCEPLDALAWIYVALNRPIEAERAFQRSVLIHRANGVPLEGSLATTLFGLGNAYYVQKKIPEAVTTLEKARVLYDKQYDANRLVGPTLNSLAFAYAAQGEFIKAEPLLRRLVSIQEAAGHPGLEMTLANLGQILRALGREGEAKELDARIRSGKTGVKKPSD